MPQSERTFWMLVSSAENFETSRARGFDLAGMKQKHGKKAAAVQPGDKVVFYLTKVQAFGGTAEVTSPAREDHDPIWASSKELARKRERVEDARGPGEAKPRRDEDYPHRFEITIEAACPAGDYEPAASLVPFLAYPKKWPAEHWRLAFQGNVHRLPEADYEKIRLACEARAKGRPRPPGAPPTEAERPPKIPARVRKPKGRR